MKKSYSLFIVIFCLMNFCYSQTAKVEAIIDFSKEKEGFVTISGKAKSLSDQLQNFSYSLNLVKSESGNNAVSKQSGNFELSQNESAVLSTVQVNLSDGSQFEFNLKIFDKEKVVAQRILKSDETFFSTYQKLSITSVQKPKESIQEIPKKSKAIEKQKIQKQATDDIEIGGLIIDDTRSKSGRDFYDNFYGKWTDDDDNASYSIIIKELPARGRAARVAVEVDGEVVITRMVQPRQELIELLAAQSVQVVKNYLSKRKKMNLELENEDQQGSGIF